MSKPLELDARRMLCPMPVIKVQNLVEDLSDGDRVKAICSDPGVMNDIPAWCRINGHRILKTYSEDDEYIIELEVKRASR